ncbi:MAG: precorrin-6y C5,15-methyltransferase (decarboxylating) subunit CbiE [Acidimicrobiia bacterium]
MTDPARVSVVGLIGGECFGTDARVAIDEATVVVGSDRQLELVERARLLGPAAERVALTGALDDVLNVIDHRRSAGGRVCILASGDPGFFGIVRVLGDRFGRPALAVHPAPSSIALAFARLGSSWDDAVVVSAHGRPLDEAVARLVPAGKAAVLTSPDSPPQVVAAALAGEGLGQQTAAVVTRIGEPEEAVFEGDLCAVAARAFDPMSILILEPEGVRTSTKGLSWGLPEHEFAHRAGMITKAEARAVALGKLDVPHTGVLWDVGAGSGSVAIEAARLCPGLRVFAIEQDTESAARIDANAAAHSVAVDVVVGTAPRVLAKLPDPDRVFIGGGGIAVLDAGLDRLRPNGVVVANYALLDRAVLGWQRLGNLVELSVSRGVGLGETGVRLAAENPVFVCWGPS